LHQVYKGLSSNVVKEAFGWNDYMQPKKWLFPKVNQYVSLLKYIKNYK
jgi:hypothetical protein